MELKHLRDWGHDCSGDYSGRARYAGHLKVAERGLPAQRRHMNLPRKDLHIQCMRFVLLLCGVCLLLCGLLLFRMQPEVFHPAQAALWKCGEMRYSTFPDHRDCVKVRNVDSGRSITK